MLVHLNNEFLYVGRRFPFRLGVLTEVGVGHHEVEAPLHFDGGFVLRVGDSFRRYACDFEEMLQRDFVVGRKLGKGLRSGPPETVLDGAQVAD